jgi:hypothetical protein
VVRVQDLHGVHYFTDIRCFCFCFVWHGTAAFNLIIRCSKIETGLSEEAADDADSDSEITNFCDQV